MHIKKIVISIFMITMISGCSTVKKPEMTPLQIQAIQVQKFNAKYKTTFKSVLSVLQDLGYTIDVANFSTGIIKAKSTSKTEHDFWWTGSKYNKRVVVTASIEQIKKYTSVRLSFVEELKVSTIYGQESEEGLIILNQKIYRSAFSKIKSAIFLRN